ncbi:DUF3800 domain-containing protein [Roseibium alexandrii]|uniref:DUF3800 domain-containing protein n=1 Tax=Roseibium alexandrii TaxID=388408 RepID=A0A0M7AIA0_9HYPH|nr:DUF3800 domain-containing protein [Roseibium alexandrii]CTQ74172.1 hypothetical protein LAX5112_03784 [Roseibium alexandrii]
MADKYIFSDEAGCFTFKKVNGASKYFMLCTVVLEDCSISNELLNIKRKLVLNGEPERNKLHATSDSVITRKEVYPIIADYDLSIDCTILEKTKAQPQTRIDDTTFYKYAWYYHFKKIGPIICSKDEKTLITAASIGNKKKRSSFKENVNNVVQQIVPREQWEVSFADSANDPCLWLADYCAWAIQRKWERNEDEFYNMIKPKINSEYDLWERGTRHYY